MTGHADRAAMEDLLEQLRAAERKAAQLEGALASNRRIGMAVGILMSRHRLTAEQGIAYLKRLSQEHNVKVRELAEGVIGCGAHERLR